MSEQPAPVAPSADLQSLFGLALDEFDRRVTAVDAGQWGTSTPCSEWDVRALVGHVVTEQLWAPARLAGETMEEIGDRFDGDVLGAEPLGSWRAAAARS